MTEESLVKTESGFKVKHIQKDSMNLATCPYCKITNVVFLQPGGLIGGISRLCDHFNGISGDYIWFRPMLSSTGEFVKDVNWELPLV